VPHALVTGAPGRRTSFEVTINDVVVFSKLKLGSFPFPEDILDRVQQAAKGESPEVIDKCQKSSCAVM